MSAKKKSEEDVTCEVTSEPTMLESKNAKGMLNLEQDMTALARKICKEIDEGKTKDYYKSIEAVINIYKAVTKKGEC